MPSIAVIQQKGGVGKSTTAVHLLAFLHEQGKRVALLDADPQRAASRWLADALPDVDAHPATDADEILDHVPELAAGVDVLVCDGPGGDGEPTRALALRADLVVVPTGPSLLDLRAAGATVRLIEQARSIRGGEPAGVLVLSRWTRTKVADEAREAAADLGLPVAQTIVYSRVAVAEAPQQGSMAWDLGGAAADAGAELRALAAEIAGMV